MVGKYRKGSHGLYIMSKDNIDDEAVFLKEGNGIKKVLINNIEQISIKKI